MYWNRCKFEFSKDPSQFLTLSMPIVNSIEASTDPDIADLFAEFFPSTYSSVSWPYTSYPNHLNKANCIFIPVTRRVKGYTRFVGMYVTGRRKRFRHHKVYIFLIRITSRVDLAMAVGPSVRMNAEISETIRARLLRSRVKIPELLTQRKFVSAENHAHSNAHKLPKPVGPTN